MRLVKRLMICLVAIGFMVPSVVMAEFYKYRDANGVMRFTDNLAEVPVDQRPKVTSYSEPDDFLTPEARKKKEVAEVQAAAAKAAPDASLEDIQEERMRLNRLRVELDEEYGGLMKDRQTLEKMKAEAKDDTDREAYRDGVIDLNKRITAYETKRVDFQKAMDAFNQRDR